MKVSDILSIEKESRIQLENLQLEEYFLEEEICQSPKLLTESLDELGTKLGYLESQYSKDDSRIIDLKKPYSLLEIRHYLAMKRRAERCNSNDSLILFFYSNDPEYIDESEQQGFILDYLKKKYDNVRVYSFDGNLELGILNLLKEKYNISIYPSTVIEGRVYAGLHDKTEFEEVIKNN